MNIVGVTGSYNFSVELGSSVALSPTIATGLGFKLDFLGANVILNEVPCNYSHIPAAIDAIIYISEKIDKVREILDKYKYKPCQ